LRSDLLPLQSESFWLQGSERECYGDRFGHLHVLEILNALQPHVLPLVNFNVQSIGYLIRRTEWSFRLAKARPSIRRTPGDNKIAS
jgi:hypothetical protein